MNAQTPEPGGPCPLFDAPLTADGSACTRCDWVPGYRQQQRLTAAQTSRDIVAAALSILPGAGHVFKGYLWAGVILAGLVTPLALLFSAALNLFAGWVVPLIYWPAVMLDAYFRRDLRPGVPPAANETPPQ